MHWLHAWLLKIVSVHTFVAMCACPPPRPLITSGVIWNPSDWLNKGYSFYVAAVANYYAKQKHLGCKKGEANQKQQLSDYNHSYT